jgi:arsenite methyltransferase
MILQNVVGHAKGVYLMVVLRVFDPPMCCSTGICGPAVDPALARFAADVNWLKAQGMQVERFNLAQSPDVFTKDSVVEQMLTKVGTECLPLIVVNGEVVSQGVYPSREELIAFAGIATRKPADRSRESFFVQATAKQNDGGGCCGGSGCCG